MGKFNVKAQVRNDDGSTRTFTVSGQTARTLLKLVERAAAGVTSLEIAATWALRTSHYIYVLRREHGLEIVMERENHEGPTGHGWHGRYTLMTPVEIIAGSVSEVAQWK